MDLNQIIDFKCCDVKLPKHAHGSYQRPYQYISLSPSNIYRCCSRLINGFETIILPKTNILTFTFYYENFGHYTTRSTDIENTFNNRITIYIPHNGKLNRIDLARLIFMAYKELYKNPPYNLFLNQVHFKESSNECSIFLSKNNGQNDIYWELLAPLNYWTRAKHTMDEMMLITH